MIRAAADRSPFVFSIRPRFVALLLAGTKTVEFRTRRPSVAAGDTVLIYETAPRSLVVASAIVGGVIVGEPAEVWRATVGRGGIDRETFDAYFAHRRTAVAVELAVTPLVTPLALPAGQHAPQAWARWRGPWPLE